MILKNLANQRFFVCLFFACGTNKNYFKRMKTIHTAMKSVIAIISPKNIVSTVVILTTYNTFYENKRGINLSFLTTKNFKNSKAISSFP